MKKFFRTIRVKGTKGDILIVLSGSGNSKNILNVLKMAKKLKLKVMLFWGMMVVKQKNLLMLSYILK